MPAGKKYKLFKAGDAPAGSRPVCAFFTSPDGCRNGDKCSFLHGKPPQPSAVEVSETASVISSESETENTTRKAETPSAAAKQAIKKEPASLTKAKPTTPSQATPKEQVSTNGKKRKANKANNNNNGDEIFANPKDKDHAPSPFAYPKDKDHAPPPSKKVKLTEKAKPVRTKSMDTTAKASPVADFRSLISKLPVASFSIPGVCNDIEKSSGKDSCTTKENPVAAATTQKPEDVLPTSTEGGRKWLKAVKSSRSHERYSGSFDFGKYKEAGQEAGIPCDWVKAKPFGSWCKSNPQAIAIDCEMCETQDPLSGVKNPKALCRLSVINAENPEEVLLDTLVKPAWPVTDYRTRINGISKDDLDKVEFTLRHAQAFMMALCSEETVIVGHAVQNDLAALNMEHYCIADSSFLFFAKESPSSSVSLKDLVATILKVEMPDTHDSVNDARKALQCVSHWVEKDGDVEAIERQAKHKSDQLFIHRIPKQCKTHHLTNMFLKHTAVEPSSVDEIEFSGDTGKTHVIFRSTRHANLAFDTLEGTAEPDKSGRLQKKVYLRTGDYVRVRKMIHTRVGSPHKTPTK